MGKLHQLTNGDIKYSSILLLKEKDLLFAGNEVGQIEVWYLPHMERRAILRYASVDEYGDPVPVEEPVVNLASPYDDSLVYAFFGTAAYCISVDLLTIIEKVPISEQVVSGNIGQYTGDIGVITTTGYLSRWSARFVERVASHDFPFDIDQCHLVHDYDEERIALIFSDGLLLLSNLGDDPYTVEFTFPEATELLSDIKFEMNQEYQILLDPSGTIQIFDSEETINLPPFIKEGKQKAEDKVRQYITSRKISEEEKQYITDFRLLRQSRDRYVAEVEQLGKSSKGSLSHDVIRNDGKTIIYAISELQKSNIDKKTTAMSVIDKIGLRHNVNSKYLYFAFRQGADSTNIIDIARYYEFEAYQRREKLTKVRVAGLSYSLLMLIIADLIIFDSSSIYIFAGLVIFGLVGYVYWRNINRNPPIPGITMYKGLQFFMILCIFFSVILVIFNSFTLNLPII